jgi:hypothetical protein
MNAMDCSIVHAPTVEPGLHQRLKEASFGESELTGSCIDGYLLARSVLDRPENIDMIYRVFLCDKRVSSQLGEIESSALVRIPQIDEIAPVRKNVFEVVSEGIHSFLETRYGLLCEILRRPLLLIL